MDRLRDAPPAQRVNSSGRNIVRACLIGLALALLLVGVVSGTLLRHSVQIVPIAAALGLLTRRADWAAYAALPLFLFWTLVPVLIWLFLLGLSRIANGHYTVIEVLSTVVMAGCSIVGAAIAVRLGKPLRWYGRAFLFLLFGVLQFVVMWVSFLEPIANR